MEVVGLHFIPSFDFCKLVRYSYQNINRFKHFTNKFDDENIWIYT